MADRFGVDKENRRVQGRRSVFGAENVPRLHRSSREEGGSTISLTPTASEDAMTQEKRTTN